MGATRKPARKRARRRQRPRTRRGAGSPAQARGIKTDVDALTERLDMMLPELIARVAATEHLLVEKGFCSHEDLVRARRFIDEQEGW